MAVAKQVGISSTGREEENELYSDKSESIYKKTDNCYTIKLSEINKEGPLNATRYIWKPTFKNKTGKITDIAEIVSDKITPTSEDNEFSKFALIRMDELQNNPVWREFENRKTGRYFISKAWSEYAQQKNCCSSFNSPSSRLHRSFARIYRD